MNNINFKVTFAVFASIVLWASAFIAIRVAVIDVKPIHVASLRFAVASILLIPVAIIFKVRMPSIVDALKMAVVGILGFTVYNILLTIGLKTVDAGTACFIVNTSPIFISIMAMFLYKEKVSLKNWISLVVCVFGVAIISLDNNQVLEYKNGILMILCAAIFHSLYTIVQKDLLKRNTAIEITCISIWFGTIALLPFVIETIEAYKASGPKPISLAVYLGVFPSIVGCLCWTYAISKMECHKLAIFLNIIPVVAVLQSMIFLNEAPSIKGVVGGMVILIGLLSSHSKMKFNNKENV